jgi:hypothetical protein
MRLIRVLAVLLCVQAVALADLKVTRKNGAGGYSGQSTVYIKGQRQRTESPAMTTIQQCDLHRSVWVNDRTKMYFIMNDDDASQSAGASAPAPASAPQGPTRRGAVVNVTESVTDTGERKQMFGFTARHIKSTSVIDAPPEACNPGRTESESDGWYIDLAAGMSCNADRPATPPSRGARPDCMDHYRTHFTGGGKLGFPVMVTTKYKSTGQGGDESMAGGFTNTMEVTDISTVTLDPSLFEIPAGYQQAASMMELMMGPGGRPDMANMPGMPPGAQPPAGEAESSTGAGIPGSGIPAASSSVGPKQPGTIRVGVAAINNRAGGSVSLDALRSRLVGAISGDGVEAVPLDASSAPAAEAEAKQKDCDFVLYTDLSALKQSAASKVGGMFGRVAGVGGGDRYESRVDFKLFAVGGASQLEANAAAKEEGAEASVGSALDKEAKAVAAAARKKK